MFPSIVPGSLVLVMVEAGYFNALTGRDSATFTAHKWFNWKEPRRYSSLRERMGGDNGKR